MGLGHCASGYLGLHKFLLSGSHQVLYVYQPRVRQENTPMSSLSSSTQLHKQDRGRNTAKFKPHLLYKQAPDHRAMQTRKGGIPTLRLCGSKTAIQTAHSSFIQGMGSWKGQRFQESQGHKRLLFCALRYRGTWSKEASFSLSLYKS